MTHCEKCGKETRKPVWLELSATDENYYTALPDGHQSQGGFPFGPDCAIKVYTKTAIQNIYTKRIDR